jgi:tetratricopeptide (TPR) repeat protein
MADASAQLARARTLMAQGRRDLAIPCLREAIGADPQSDEAFAQLSMCLAWTGQPREAVEAARRAVELAPNDEFNHYALAHALVHRGQTREALAAAKRAIDLEPQDERNWHMLAMAQLVIGESEQALNAAEQGLTLAPEDKDLNELKATALTRLGRPQGLDEARRALAANPESAVAHANMGWALAHAGDPKQAIGHFRESLRLEPDSAFAREGILECMKARSPLYRPILAYFLFARRFSDRQAWWILGGFALAIIVLYRVRDSVPALAPILHVVLGLLFAACVVLMFGPALFNLILRFDPFGRHVLTPRQSRLAMWLGIVMVPTAVASIANGLLGDLAWRRASLVLLCIAILLAILPDVEHKLAARIGDWLAIGMGAAALLLVANYLVVPLGLHPLMLTYSRLTLGGAVALWLWSTLAPSET